MAESAGRQWWSYTKEEQKRRLEDAVDEFLSKPGETPIARSCFFATPLAMPIEGSLEWRHKI